MLTIEEALARCLEAARPVAREDVVLEVAYGRVLAADVYAPSPLPAWDNSAMDGFAVRASELAPGDPTECDGPRPEGEGVALRVQETIPAGKVGAPLKPGFCARIMTGAPLPEGADAVVMREDSESLAPDPDGQEWVMLRGGARPGQHVRRRGDEVRPGDLVLSAGQALRPAAVGLAASFGLTSLPVARKPRVAIVSTGDELAPPGQPPQPGQIWSSNAATLAGLVLEAGGVPIDCGIAPDTIEGTRAAFSRARGSDLVLSTGGVSVGDFDVVKQALSDEDAELRFWKVRMKPGKPLAFGVIAGRPVFGLPGNPVSCVVNFLQFVRPVIRRSLGDPRPFLPVLDAVLRGGLRRSPGREELVRVALSWEEGRLVARPTRAQGSGSLSGLVGAHGLALIAADRAEVADGETVGVQVFDTDFWLSEAPGYRW